MVKKVIGCLCMLLGLAFFSSALAWVVVRTGPLHHFSCDILVNWHSAAYLAVGVMLWLTGILLLKWRNDT